MIDYIIAVSVIVILCFIVLNGIRNRKNNSGSCSGCSSCPSSQSCHKVMPTAKEE